MSEYNKNNETRICKECGRKLPLDKFPSKKMEDGTRKCNSRVCKECKNKQQREDRKEKAIQDFIADESMKLKRKYKEVRPEKILSADVSGITPIADDEVFVKLIDYRNAWISNYCRMATMYNGKYSIMQKKRVDGEVAYQLYKNVYDGKKWTYEKQLVKAWKLVVHEFIINYDIANNTCCWYKGNDKEDLYYKNLYPLNEKQYAAVQEQFEKDGEDSEESILDIMNAVEYKADNWSPKCMKKTVCGVGYLGRSGVDANSKAYRKWANMMQRCYYDKVHEYKPYYKSCTVNEEWWNFANFEVWYNENHIAGRKRDLDKDLLVQGNTEYGADTCALVTHYTNTIFEKSKGTKNNIILNTNTGLYDTTMIILDKKMNVGSFGTKDEARKGLMEYKRDYIHQFARKNEKLVPNKVFQAMMNWKVNIEDTEGLSA